MFKIFIQITFCWEIERRGLLRALPLISSSLDPLAEPSYVLIFAENLLALLFTIRCWVIEVGGGIIVKLTSFISLFP